MKTTHMKRRGLAFASFFALALAAPLCASAAVGMKINEDCATAEFSFDASETARELVLGYGLTDAGADAAAWDNSVKVADVPAGATSLSGIALPAGCGTSWKVARAFMPREATARDYIRRGLVLQYDGRENAGYGRHEDAPSAWKDLIGGNDLPLLQGDAVSADYVTVSTNVHETAGNVIDSYMPLMFEVYTSVSNLVPWAGNNSETDYGTLMEVPNVGRLGFWGHHAFLTVVPTNTTGVTLGFRQTYKVGPYGNLGADLCDRNNPKWRTWSAYMAPLASLATIGVRYTNGEVKGLDGQGRSHLTTARPAELTLRVSGNDGTHGTINKIGSIRIYDRELTAEEVAYNRAIDVARFEGGVFSQAASGPAYAPTSLAVERVSNLGSASASATLSFAGAAQSRRLYVAYGPRDAGTATNAYAGCDFVCNVAAGAMSATVAVPEAASAYLSVRGGCRFLLEAPLSASDYVTNGLVLQYDATENSGRHAPGSVNLSAWRDLVGGNDLPLLSSDAVSADCVQISSNVHWSVENVVPAYKALFYEAYTKLDSYHGPQQNSGNNANYDFGTLIEVPNVGRMGYRGTFGSFLTTAPNGSRSAGWWRIWNSGAYTPGNVRQMGWRTWSADMSAGTGGAGGHSYQNGASLTQNTGVGDVVWTWPAELKLKVGGNGPQGNGTVNSFRSIRIYDRTLTPDEVAYNRAVDVARYEGGVSPVFEWSEFFKPERATILTLR